MFQTNLLIKMRTKKERNILKAAVVLAIIIAAIGGFALWFQCMIPEVPRIPEYDLGDEELMLTYSADAKLITPKPEENGGGIEPMVATSLFSDNFEIGDLSNWDHTSSHVAVTSSKASEGDYSCQFSPCGPSVEYIKKEDALDTSSDCPVSLEFDVYITCGFQMGSYILPPYADYFFVKLDFDNGKSLVYLMGGMYIGQAGEAVIDIRHLLDGKMMWNEIVIDNIQEDYYVQFGDTMPHTADLEFYFRSLHGDGYIDAVRLDQVCDPEVTWHWAHGGEEVIAYFVNMTYQVQISDDINESSVWTEIKLWITVENNEEETIENDTLLQNAVIPVVSFGENLTWTSKTFDLPDDNEDGNELTYIFDMYVSVVAQIENSSILVGDSEKQEAFDSFTVTWTSDSVIILSWIGVIGGAVGAVGIVFGVVRRRKKKLNALKCDPETDPNCHL